MQVIYIVPLESSEENATTGEVTIIPLREDYDKLSALLPDDHDDLARVLAAAPSHDGNGSGAR